MGLRIGADIGGTFTDVVAEDGEQRWSVKVPTTHAAPEDAVLRGVERVLAEAGRPLSDAELLVHGTTLATNALIERKGAVTALLTTAGFRDVLEMGNEGRFDQYDLRVERPVPLVPRRLRFTAVERLRHDGSVVTALDGETVRRAGAAMRAAKVEAAAICFLHAYANGAHEAQARALLAETLPGVPISVSHEVSPEMREFERASTTVSNAYLQPVISAYLLRLEARLKAVGLGGPMLMILSSGGLTTVETASLMPIRLLESGPAGGAIFAGDIARRMRLDRVLSFDLGGTTAKFCLIDGAEPRTARSFEVGRTYRFKKGSGLPVRVPVIDLVEIGAGGGSIARVDTLGRIAVGPDSAGSEPGPACYGRGGTAATVTDADLAQGKLDPVDFAGGTMPLDPIAAIAALECDLSAVTGLSVENAAYAVTETVSETMAAAARTHAAEIGADPTERTLIAFGGGAPLHAARFAEKLGITEVIVPPGAGVGSAIGFLRAPLAFESTRSLRLLLPGGDPAAVGTALDAAEAQAAAIVRAVPGDDALIVTRKAFMRYVGQGHEIEVGVEAPFDAPDFIDRLHAAFTAAYRELYGRVIPDALVEATSWTVRVSRAAPSIRAHRGASRQAENTSPRRRRVYDGAAGRWEDWVERRRNALDGGARLAGPAIITEAETTTIVPRGWNVTADEAGYLRLERES